MLYESLWAKASAFSCSCGDKVFCFVDGGGVESKNSAGRLLEQFTCLQNQSPAGGEDKPVQERQARPEQFDASKSKTCRASVAPHTEHMQRESCAAAFTSGVAS